MADEKYNGWSNYETWNVKLWLDNDEGSYRHWQRAARETRDASGLAKQLEAEHEELIPELPGFASDLFRSAFDRIDWIEIAESLIEDNPSDEDDEDEDA